MKSISLNLSKTELDYLRACVDAARYPFFGANEEERIKLHGDRYLLWKQVTEKLQDAENQGRLDRWL